jgi:hypothetical protein
MSVCAQLQVGSGCTEGATKCDPSGNGHQLKCVSNAWVDNGVNAGCAASSYPSLLSIIFQPNAPAVGQAVTITVSCKAPASGYAAGLKQNLLINGTVAGTSDPLSALTANQEFVITWTANNGFNTAGTYNICAQWVGDTATLCGTLVVGGGGGSSKPTISDMTFVPAAPSVGQKETITVAFTTGASGYPAGLVQELVINGTVGGTTDPMPALAANTPYTTTWSTSDSGFSAAGTYAICARWKGDAASALCKNLVVGSAGCTEGATQCSGTHQQKCISGAWADQGCNVACGGCTPGQTKCDGNRHKQTCNSDGCGWTDGGATSDCAAGNCTAGDTRCNGFVKQICQGSPTDWQDQGCSTDCGATCTQDGTTKCVEGSKYLCQGCTYTNQGIDASCGSECATGDFICWIQKYKIPVAVASVLGIGLLGGIVVMTGKKKGGSSGSSFESDVESGLGNDLDTNWYGRI